MTTIPAVVTIPDLPAGTSVTGTELFEAVQTSGGVGNSVKLTLSQMVTGVVGGLPSGAGTGQILLSAGTGLLSQWANIASNVLASTGLAQAGSTTVSLSLASTAGLSVLGVGGTGSAVPAAIVGTADQVLIINHAGNTAQFGAVNLATSAAVTGVLPIANGGTNTSTLTAFGTLYAGASAVGVASPGGINTFLAGNGTTTAPSYTAFPTVNVVAYGADPTGVAVSDNAIASAITALPASGGDVLFPSGTYKITKTISIGSGGGSTISPTSGVRLVGVGLSALPYAGQTTVPSVAINWGTTNPSTMLVVQGPLQGWGIQNIAFKGNGTATIGIQGISCEWGDTKNVSISGCTLVGLELTCWSTIAAGLIEANSMHNRFENLNISVATSNNAGGIDLTGNAGITANSCYNKFDNVVVNLPTSGASTGVYGVYLGSADSNKFSDLHILGGTTGQVGIELDYSVGSAFPSNNFFYDVDPAGNNLLTQFFQNSSPAPTASPNTIYGLVTVNGGSDPAITGLTVYGPKDLQISGLGKFGSKTAFVSGGTTSFGIQMSSASVFGVFCGTGSPSISAGTGSLYMRSDATTVAQRLYVNTNGATGWTNFTTAA